MLNIMKIVNIESKVMVSVIIETADVLMYFCNRHNNSCDVRVCSTIQTVATNKTL